MRNVLMIGVLAVSLTACQQSPDVEEMATGALESAALADQVDAEYDESARVVRLSGTVDDATARQRAYDVVRTSVGDRAQIANEIVVEGAHAEAADDMDGGIEERFETLWQNSPELESENVDLRVENGVVTLTGEVATEAERVKVEGLARSIPGVRDVVNSITVNPEAPRRRPAPER